MAAAKVYWLGTKPKKCQICNHDIKDQFIDGATTFGSWAIQCEHCFFFGMGVGVLGTGKGQKYEKQKNNRWLKTGG